MFKITSICLLFFFAITLPAQAQKKKDLIKKVEELNAKVQALEAAKNVNLNDPTEKLSYCMGVSIAQSIIKQVEEIRTPAFEQGLVDVKEGKAMMSAQEANAYIQGELARLAEAKSAGQKAEGMSFLQENGKKEGVTTLPSGLQYEVLQTGTGAKPASNDRVTVHYKGYFMDGEVFDSSIERGEPTTFGVTQVIAGWTEALKLMSVGDKWRLFIPYDLAYGENGKGSIPGYSTLLFEVELLGIEGK
jgi:FKBP-type peptidyl-prolyl cis-trans isomerase FklB